MKPEENPWRLERRVPMLVVLTLLLQLGGILVWAAQLDARVSDMEQQVVSSSGLNEKFARLEERLDNLKQNIEAMKHQLDRLTDRLLQQ